VDPRAGLDDMEKRKFLTLPGLELRSLDRPSHSQSLYRLHWWKSKVMGKVRDILWWGGRQKVVSQAALIRVVCERRREDGWKHWLETGVAEF
jgi:hypothetical protein